MNLKPLLRLESRSKRSSSRPTFSSQCLLTGSHQTTFLKGPMRHRMDVLRGILSTTRHGSTSKLISQGNTTYDCACCTCSWHADEMQDAGQRGASPATSIDARLPLPLLSIAMLTITRAPLPVVGQLEYLSLSWESN